MADRIVHLLEPKNPEDEVRTPVINFGPRLAAGETVSAVEVTIWELDRFGIEGADYTGEMLIPGTVTFSAGGAVWFDYRNGSDNKTYGARVKPTFAPSNRTDTAILILPIRKRMK